MARGIDWADLEDWSARLALRAERVTKSPGISRAKALRRARRLLAEIVSREIAPCAFAMDREGKTVLRALVYDLVRDGGAEARLHAPAVHRFIEGVRWLDDVFGAREELLRECALAAGGEVTRSAPSARTLRVVKSGSARAAAEDLGEEELHALFEENRVVIRSVFKDRFDLSDLEAERLEGDLHSWFLRAWRRSRLTPTNLRAVLLSACVTIGRARCRLSASGFPESENGGA